VLFLSEITLRIRNWHTVPNLKFEFSKSIVICYMTLRSEQLLPNLLKKMEVELRVKLICKRSHVNRSATKLKTGIRRLKIVRTAETHKQWEHY